MKLRDILLIVVGTALMAFAVASIFDPSSLITGGFSGLAIIIRQLTKKLVPGGVPLSVTNLILNVPFLLLAVKLKGFRYLLRTGFATVMLSFWLSVLPVIPIAEGDLLLSALYLSLIHIWSDSAGRFLFFCHPTPLSEPCCQRRLLRPPAQLPPHRRRFP